ncbi:MAG: hypothetical protein ACHQ6U_03045 [Thermodesulfobacteriota bacterium]
MADDSLAYLYTKNLGAKSLVKKAVGYGVVSDIICNYCISGQAMDMEYYPIMQMESKPK